MEYKILKDASVEGLSVKVNKLIMLAGDSVQGWRPQGGLVVQEDPNQRIWYAQAMVKD